MEFKRIAIIGRWIFCISAFMGFVFWIYLMVTSWSSSLLWTGFVEYTTKMTEERENKDPKSTVTKFTEEKQTGKTLWDWLQLAGTVAIPVVLAGGGYLLNQREQERDEKRKEAEQNRAAENLREEALQTYFDRISELLLEHNLGKPENHRIPAPNPDQNDFPAKDIARIRTLTVLSRLDSDGQRKAAIVRFLHEAALIKKEGPLRQIYQVGPPQIVGPIINLDRADLRGAILNGVNLSDANLSGADLSGAILTKANLRGANLINADLRGADLSYTDLKDANLTFAILNNADLREADLKDADLTKAILAMANLLEADLDRANLTGAILTSAKNLSPLLTVRAKLCETTLPDGEVSNRDCEKPRKKNESL